FSDELLIFASGVQGVVLDLEPGRFGVILLGPSEHIRLGEAVYRTRKVVSVPVGPRLLGRIVDAIGRPRDTLGPIIAAAEHPIEAEAPSILNRTPIFRPLATGLKAIDAARSEERRVGKECSVRGWPDEYTSATAQLEHARA